MDYTKVSKQNFRFSKLRKYDEHYFSSILYGKEPLIIETPVVEAASGIVRSKNKTHIVLQIPNESSDFTEFLKMVDHMCVNMTLKNRKDWFSGRKVTKEMIASAYQTPIIKKSPTLTRFLLGGISKIYNHRGEKIVSTKIKPSSKLKCTLQLSGLWVTGNFIGVHWQIEKIVLLSSEQSEPTKADKTTTATRKRQLKVSRRDSDEDDEYMRFRKQFDANATILQKENEDFENEDFESEEEDEYNLYKRKLEEAKQYYNEIESDEDGENSEDRRRLRKKRRSYESSAEASDEEVEKKGNKINRREIDFSKLNYGKNRKSEYTYTSEEEEELGSEENIDEQLEFVDEGEIKKVNFGNL